MNLKTVQTPALLLDLDKFTRNCNWMKEKAERLHVALRPHLKTGKCIEFAKVQMTSPSGPATVSTLLEAEYFFNLGVIDLIYAVGISPGKFERAINLREAGCDLKVILDNKETAEQFSAYCEERKIPCPVLIEIDVDGHRSGVKPDSDGLIEIAKILQGKAYFAGVLTHAGDSYKCVGQAACLKAQENERDSLVHCANRLRKAGFDPKIISAGSTPTAVFAESWEGVTEVRCGVYCLFDLVMAGLKVCTIDQIALSLLVEVTGHQKEKGWIITDGGWMALSRDRGTAAQAVDQGYGVVCDIDGNPIDDLIVASANQEHGIITHRDGRLVDPKDFPIGLVSESFRIMPAQWLLSILSTSSFVRARSLIFGTASMAGSRKEFHYERSYSSVFAASQRPLLACCHF